MLRAYPKILAVLMALVFTGAAHACMCVGMTVAHAKAQLAPSSAHDCCKTPAPVSHRPASPDDPCKDCNARHPQALATPEKSLAVPALDLAPLAACVTDLSPLRALVARPAYRVTDDVPIPPQLRDLHHTYCMLTV